VAQIKKQNDGSPFSSQSIQVKGNGVFSKTLELRENDVYFLNLVKQ